MKILSVCFLQVILGFFKFYHVCRFCYSLTRNNPNQCNVGAQLERLLILTHVK